MSNLTTEEVAARLRLTQDTVRRMCRRGDLLGSYVGGQWLIDEDDLADFLAEKANRSTRRRRRRGAVA